MQTRMRTRTLCIQRTLCKHVTVGTPMVICAVLTGLDCFSRLNSVPIVKNSQKTVKTAKMTIGVPIVTRLHRVRRIHKAPIGRQHTP